MSSSLCRVETSDIVEGPWCSSSVRGAGREERRTNSFERTRGFGQLRETTSGEALKSRFEGDVETQRWPRRSRRRSRRRRRR